MDATKLQSWLPVLEHPEHGAAICEAAGIYPEIIPYKGSPSECNIWDTKTKGTGRLIFIMRTTSEPLPRWISSALALGTLAVVWNRRHVDDLVRMCWDTIEDSDFDPAAILAAAYRWLGIEVSA